MNSTLKARFGRVQVFEQAKTLARSVAHSGLRDRTLRKWVKRFPQYHCRQKSHQLSLFAWCPPSYETVQEYPTQSGMLMK